MMDVLAIDAKCVYVLYINVHACIESSFNQGNIIHLHVSEVAGAHHLQQNSFVLDFNDVFLCPSSLCWYEKWSGPMEGHIYSVCMGSFRGYNLYS